MALEQITGEVVADDQEDQPKSKLAAMKKAKDDAIAAAEKKKKLLTPERTMEVADSLDKEGVNKISLAVDIRNKNKKLLEPSYLNKKDANKISNEGWSDLENSTRYKSLALKAMNKNQ